MHLIDKPNSTKEFLFLSDFDQTLSFQELWPCSKRSAWDSQLS